jgi:hypothetical protein
VPRLHRDRGLTLRGASREATQHDQPAGILLDAASIDCAGDREVVVTVKDFLDAGAFTAGKEKLDAVFCPSITGAGPPPLALSERND